MNTENLEADATLAAARLIRNTVAEYVAGAKESQQKIIVMSGLAMAVRRVLESETIFGDAPLKTRMAEFSELVVCDDHEVRFKKTH